jgi:hypothetical protein
MPPRRVVHVDNSAIQHHHEHGTADAECSAVLCLGRAGSHRRTNPRQDRCLQGEGHVDGRQLTPRYDVQNRKLVVNDDEARTVVDIFRRYLVLKSVHTLREELASAGIRSKRRIRPDGAEYVGQKLFRGARYLMLQSRIYRGEITPDEVLRRDTGYHTCPLGADIAAAARIPFPAHRHSVVAAHWPVAAERDNKKDFGP